MCTLTIVVRVIFLMSTLQLTKHANVEAAGDLLNATGKLTQNADGFDIIQCEFPLLVTLSRVDLHRPTASEPDFAIVDCGTSCEVRDSHKGLLRLVSPVSKTSDTVFTFNISHTEETAGNYICFGLPSQEGVSPPPGAGAATTRGQESGTQQVKEASAAPKDSNSAGLAALIVIPIVLITGFILLYILYRRRQLRCLEANRADAEQPSCLGFVRTILASLQSCVDCSFRRRPHGDGTRSVEAGDVSLRKTSSDSVTDEDEGCNGAVQPLLAPVTSPSVEQRDDDDHVDDKQVSPSSFSSSLRHDRESAKGAIASLSPTLTSSFPPGERKRQDGSPESNRPSRTSPYGYRFGVGEDDDELDLSSLPRQLDTGGSGSADDNVSKQGVGGFLDARNDTGPTSGYKKGDFPDETGSGGSHRESASATKQIPDSSEAEVDREREDEDTKAWPNIEEKKGEERGKDGKEDEEEEKEGAGEEKGSKVGAESLQDMKPRRRSEYGEEGGTETVHTQEDEEYNTASDQDDQSGQPEDERRQSHDESVQFDVHSGHSEADGAGVDHDDAENMLRQLPHRTEAPPGEAAPPEPEDGKRKTIKRLSDRLKNITSMYSDGDDKY